MNILSDDNKTLEGHLSLALTDVLGITARISLVRAESFSDIFRKWIRSGRPGMQFFYELQEAKTSIMKKSGKSSARDNQVIQVIKDILNPPTPPQLVIKSKYQPKIYPKPSQREVELKRLSIKRKPGYNPDNGRKKKHSRKLYQYFINGPLVREWENATEASIALKLNRANISSCATKNSRDPESKKSAGGYYWTFILKSDNNI